VNLRGWLGAGLWLVLTAVATAVDAEGGIKMYQVKSGDLIMDKGWLTAMRDVGKVMNVPITMEIIDHPRGLVIFDTGNNVAVSDGKCESHWGKLCTAFKPTQTRDEVIDRWLEKFGYKVEDVKYVVLSHMHLDTRAISRCSRTRRSSCRRKSCGRHGGPRSSPPAPR
jgi:beta-lactamase superfamily II metal-dependent hydrolase